MKTKELDKIRSRSLKELERDLVDLKDKLFSMQQDVQKGKEKNVHRAKGIKKDISQTRTIINQKKKEAALAESEEK